MWRCIIFFKDLCLLLFLFSPQLSLTLASFTFICNWLLFTVFNIVVTLRGLLHLFLLAVYNDRDRDGGSFIRINNRWHRGYRGRDPRVVIEIIITIVTQVDLLSAAVFRLLLRLALLLHLRLFYHRQHALVKVLLAHAVRIAPLR